MSSIINFETFLIAGILLNITPGNDTIFILTKSIGQGKKAGIISVLGIGTGCIVHTILAAFGLSIIISKSILLFNIIKFAGVAYLFYMGYQMMRQKTVFDPDVVQRRSIVNYGKIYRDAVLTNVLNPKVALFFIAFLPQFIDASSKSTVLPFLLLGTTFVITGTLWCFGLAVFASTVFKKLINSTRVAGYVTKICGLTLIALGIKVALTDK